MDFYEKISSLLKGHLIGRPIRARQYVFSEQDFCLNILILKPVRSCYLGHQIDLENPSTRVDILSILYFSKNFQIRRCYDFCQVDLSIGQDY